MKLGICWRMLRRSGFLLVKRYYFYSPFASGTTIIRDGEMRGTMNGNLNEKREGVGRICLTSFCHRWGKQQR